MVSFMYALTRTRSVHAFGVSTTSRGCDAFVAHSDLYSVQNSTHPIGARVTSPTVTNNAGSACAAATPESAAQQTQIDRSPCLKRPAICGPFPVIGATFPTHALEFR